MPTRVAVLLVATVFCASAEVRVHGVVLDAASSAPVAGAQVLAIEDGRRIAASATTDAEGQYELIASVARFELTVDAVDYFAVRAGDVEAERIARDCPEAGDCGETNFLLSRAATFDGWIRDKYGNPLETIELTLAAEGANDGPRPPRPLLLTAQERNRNMRSVSDDRGYFRFWGLRPGSYRLTSRRGGMRYPGIPEPPELNETVEISAGEEHVRIDYLLAEPLPTYTISGTLEGVAEGDTRWITLEPLGGGERQIVYVNDGKFTHPAPAGRYAARLEKLVNADPAANESDLLATLVVNSDLSDLRLRPQPRSGVRVRAAFVDGTPRAFRLRLEAKDRPDSPPREIQFDDPRVEIERGGFLPGDYVGSVRAGEYFLVEQPEITVVPGQMTAVELQLSGERSTVHGTARFAEAEERRPAAQITVGVRGRETREVRTDDKGVFVLEGLIPGEYEIAAWDRPQVFVQQDEVWEEAEERVRRIQVEPGFEVEVDLTIAR